MGNLNFDATNIPPYSESFDPLPAGWYDVFISSAEMTHGKSQDAGEMLKIAVEVNGNTHPEFKGRKVFAYLCLNHKRDATRNIARKMISSIAHSIGQMELGDTDDILGKEIMAKFKIRPARDGYDASNDVAGFAALGTQKTNEAPGVSPPTSTDNKPTGGAASRSWK